MDQATNFLLGWFTYDEAGKNATIIQIRKNYKKIFLLTTTFFEKNLNYEFYYILSYVYE